MGGREPQGGPWSVSPCHTDTQFGSCSDGCVTYCRRPREGLPAKSQRKSSGTAQLQGKGRAPQEEGLAGQKPGDGDTPRLWGLAHLSAVRMQSDKFRGRSTEPLASILHNVNT